MAHIKLAKTRKDYRRKPENVKMYTSTRWVKLRKRKVADFPLCEECLKEGKTTPTQLVHHIKPWQLGRNEYEQDELQFDYDNLQSLCHDCHNKIHNKMNIAAAFERKGRE